MALQGSVGEIRTNEEHFSLKNEKKIKNSQPQTKFTGSYKKKECKQHAGLLKKSSSENLVYHLFLIDNYLPKWRKNDATKNVVSYCRSVQDIRFIWVDK